VRASGTLNDDGIKQLAIVVRQQTINDLGCVSETDGQSASAFIARENFDVWCVLALNPAAARERLRKRQTEAA
jgi:hypothetical protein